MVKPLHTFLGRKSVLFSAILLITLLFTGCAEIDCTTCNQCPTGVELESERFCEDDFNETADYQQAIDLAVSFGCTCTSD